MEKVVKNKKPNIFDIATKELSQDAFIVWLLQYADDECKNTDPYLSECGKEFVKQLIKKQIPDFNEPITKVEAGRQWENVDIWAEVNNKYLIIIEDKTSSSSHSDQLLRYKNTSDEWCKENDFRPVYIYFKIGSECKSSLEFVERQGFSVFTRKDMISVLEKFYNKTSNDIFNDFYERLHRIEQVSKEFESKPIKDWDKKDWENFFVFLDEQMGNIDWWGYVNNPKGGFWCATFYYGDDYDYWGPYYVFIQLEESKLCFKIKVDNPKNRTEARNGFYDLIIKKANEKGLYVRKPDRFGSGNYMTAAVVDSQYWFRDDNEYLNKEKVIKTLNEYIKFLHDITQ